MKKLKQNREQGLIKYLVVIIAAIILIAYFKNEIQAFLSSPGIKDALLLAISWIQKALLWIVKELGLTSSQINVQIK